MGIKETLEAAAQAAKDGWTVAVPVGATDKGSCPYWSDGIHCYEAIRAVVSDVGGLEHYIAKKSCACGHVVERTKP